MQHDTDPKESASDTTPPSEPRPANPSEAEFLEREADDARGAVSSTLDDMRQSLKDAGDVSAWARTYPWTTLGAAAAAGFLVATAVVPRRDRRNDEDAALLERILTDEQIEARLRELAEDDKGRPRRDGLLHKLAGSLVETLGPAVQSAIAAALAARPPETGAGNGQEPPAASDGTDSAEADEPPTTPD